MKFPIASYDTFAWIGTILVGVIAPISVVVIFFFIKQRLKKYGGTNKMRQA